MEGDRGQGAGADPRGRARRGGVLTCRTRSAATSLVPAALARSTRTAVARRRSWNCSPRVVLDEAVPRAMAWLAQYHRKPFAAALQQEIEETVFACFDDDEEAANEALAGIGDELLGADADQLQRIAARRRSHPDQVRVPARVRTAARTRGAAARSEPARLARTTRTTAAAPLRHHPGAAGQRTYAVPLSPYRAAADQRHRTRRQPLVARGHADWCARDGVELRTPALRRDLSVLAVRWACGAGTLRALATHARPRTRKTMC